MEDIQYVFYVIRIQIVCEIMSNKTKLIAAKEEKILKTWYIWGKIIWNMAYHFDRVDTNRLIYIMLYCPLIAHSLSCDFLTWQRNIRLLVLGRIISSIFSYGGEYVQCELIDETPSRQNGQKKMPRATHNDPFQVSKAFFSFL